MCSVIENAPEGLVAVLGGEGSGRGGAEGRKGEGKLDHGGDGGTQPKSAVSDEELARQSAASAPAGWPSKKYRKRGCTTS